MLPFQARGAALVAVAWLLALSVAWMLYAPGLGGSFIFDDAPNLGGLNAIEAGSLSDITAYSLQGIAGPTGRPLSLLSFALQHESWPDQPADFKRVNILIHLLNATLVLWLLTAIEGARRTTGPARWVLPAAAALLWMLWPIQVSSVLYVVQRMTLLSGTCVLLGLVLYVKARIGLERETSRTQWISHLLFLASLATGIGMGILFKENAIVFPLLAIALGGTLLTRLPPEPRLWTALLWAPLIVLVAYLALSSHTFAPYQIRDFNLTERLLTQSRVLWMYVSQILMPSAGSLRFLYDDFPISRGPFAPATTTLALGFLLLTAAAAWKARRQYPVPSFAVFFFLASHALESTVLPLELVFEHRNYIGSLAIAYGLTCALWAGLERTRSQGRKMAVTVAGIAYLALVSLACLNLTTLWGNPLLQKKFWYESNPTSARVHMEFAAQLLLQGHANEASVLLEQASARFPQDMSFPVARIELACYYPELRPASLGPALSSLQSGTAGVLSAVIYLDRLGAALQEDHCDVYTPDEAQSLIGAAQQNPSFRVRQQDLIVLSGSLHSHAGNIELARVALQTAIAMHPKPSLLVQAAAWEIGNNNLPEAQNHISKLKSLKDSDPTQYFAIRENIKSLEKLMSRTTQNNSSSK